MSEEMSGNLVDKSSSSSFEDLAAASDLAEAREADTDSKNTSEDREEEKEEWQDILGSGFLLKKELVAGDDSEGIRPQRGNICRVSYEIRLQETQELIEKCDGVKIYLGDNEVLQGLDLALSLMYAKEECLLKMAPRFCYGNLGLKAGDPLGSVSEDENAKYNGPIVLPNAWIEAKVTLHDWDEDPDHETLSIPERMKLGCRRRARGNWWYGRGEAQLAVQLYRRALDALDESNGGISDPTPSGDMEPTSSALHQLLEERVRVHNNMAAAQLKAGAYEAALQSVQHVLSCQPLNAKALFRKSKILSAMGNSEGALEAARAAVAAAPEDQGARRELARCEARVGRDRSAERRLARAMLGGARPAAPSPAAPDAGKPASRKVLVWGSLLLSLLVGVASVLVYRYRTNASQ